MFFFKEIWDRKEKRKTPSADRQKYLTKWCVFFYKNLHEILKVSHWIEIERQACQCHYQMVHLNIQKQTNTNRRESSNPCSCILQFEQILWQFVVAVLSFVSQSLTSLLTKVLKLKIMRRFYVQWFCTFCLKLAKIFEMLRSLAGDLTNWGRSFSR